MLNSQFIIIAGLVIIVVFLWAILFCWVGDRVAKFMSERIDNSDKATTATSLIMLCFFGFSVTIVGVCMQFAGM